MIYFIAGLVVGIPIGVAVATYCIRAAVWHIVKEARNHEPI